MPETQTGNGPARWLPVAVCQERRKGSLVKGKRPGRPAGKNEYSPPPQRPTCMNLHRPLFLLLALGATVFAHAQPRDRDDDRDGERENTRRSGPRVIFYQHANYRGDELVVYPGDALDNFSGRTFENGTSLNDEISSIRVERGAEVYIYENSRYRGQVLRLTESVRDLTGRLMPDNPSASWNDRISSFRVELLRRGLGGPPRGDVDVVIKKVYRELLSRAPDEGGLRYYHGLMLDQGWTEKMVREHIQHSEEFRREGADRILRRAYLDVLGREADPGGLKHYREQLDRGWTEGDVRDDLRRSEEYRRKPHKG